MQLQGTLLSAKGPDMDRLEAIDTLLEDYPIRRVLVKITLVGWMCER